MSYIFKDIKKLEDYVYDNFTSGVDTVSEVDIDEKRIYLEVGAGTEILTITINQDNGEIKMKLSRPNSDNNEWYWITQRDDVFEELQSFVKKTNNSRNTRKNRNNRNKNTRKNRSN